MANRLAAEQSPYLLQHADNPVDWFAWGAEAFRRSREEDKPIFLSVGYSTCHWCHVMAHESFENPEVAELLNRHFVPVKVDREERPDVDRVYMTFVQATTGSGGWPMSVWLTPALQPFYGGTYFPPSGRWGRPGFVEVLTELARLWREEREKVIRSAETLTERLRATGEGQGGGGHAGARVLEAAVDELASAYDRRWGGFGGAPKFPRPTELWLLLREYARTGRGEARAMVEHTLRAMAAGGMRDHVGGGFHRYSVDARWRVPHFEKMLYDQSQLVLACLEAAQASGDRSFLEVASDTLRYVLGDLTAPSGGFYCAEDADSVPPEQEGQPGAHKSEGAFYLWTDEEIGAVLGEDAPFVRLRFGIEHRGNVHDDPHGEFTGKNILHVAREIDEIAQLTGRDPGVVEAALTRARGVLVTVRSRRPRPHLDDKILTAWNGLMIGALARASRVVSAWDDREGREQEAAAYLEAGRKAARFLLSALWDAGRRRLLRSYRESQSAIEGYAEDYACLVFGLLELFQADGDPEWLRWAIDLQARQDELFWDPRGGWFSTTGEDPSLLMRLKEDYDGAEPSASSVSVLNLLVLSHLAGDEGMRRKIDVTLSLFAGRLHDQSRALPLMAAARSVLEAGMGQVVIVGERGNRLEAVVNRRYDPFAILVPVRETHRDGLSRLLPLVAPMARAGERAVAYVCRDFVCRSPTTEAGELERQLAPRARG